jgi:hypothetical protein
MKGKLLAVYSLAGPVRLDLPASLLAEGNLAGVGVAEASPGGVAGIARELADFAGALDEARGGVGVERLPNPFVWFY